MALRADAAPVACPRCQEQQGDTDGECERDHCAGVDVRMVFLSRYLTETGISQLHPCLHHRFPFWATQQYDSPFSYFPWEHGNKPLVCPCIALKTTQLCLLESSFAIPSFLFVKAPYQRSKRDEARC